MIWWIQESWRAEVGKLARSLGSASHEFRKGVEEGSGAKDKTDASSEEEKPGQPT